MHQRLLEPAFDVSRLNMQERMLRDHLNGLPEFGLSGYLTAETRTFRGLVIRRGNVVRGLWSYSDSEYRWIPISSGCEYYATPALDRALRHTMMMVLNSLVVRRAIRLSGMTEAQAATTRVA